MNREQSLLACHPFGGSAQVGMVHISTIGPCRWIVFFAHVCFVYSNHKCRLLQQIQPSADAISRDVKVVGPNGFLWVKLG